MIAIISAALWPTSAKRIIAFAENRGHLRRLLCSPSKKSYKYFGELPPISDTAMLVVTIFIFSSSGSAKPILLLLLLLSLLLSLLLLFIYMYIYAYTAYIYIYIPKGNGIGATGSKNPRSYYPCFSLLGMVLRTCVWF